MIKPEILADEVPDMCENGWSKSWLDPAQFNPQELQQICIVMEHLCDLHTVHWFTEKMQSLVFPFLA